MGIVDCVLGLHMQRRTAHAERKKVKRRAIQSMNKNLSGVSDSKRKVMARFFSVILLD